LHNFGIFFAQFWYIFCTILVLFCSSHLAISKRTRVMNEKLTHLCELMDLVTLQLSLTYPFQGSVFRNL
jgi:hypothetical protein